MSYSIHIRLTVEDEKYKKKIYTIRNLLSEYEEKMHSIVVPNLDQTFERKTCFVE